MSDKNSYQIIKNYSESISSDNWDSLCSQMTVQIDSEYFGCIADVNAIQESIRYFQYRFSDDSFAVFGSNPNPETARAVAECMIWRTGLFYSILLSAGVVPQPNKHMPIELLVKSVVKINNEHPYFALPEETMFLRLTALFENTEPDKLDSVAKIMLRELGFGDWLKEAEIVNSDYAHPVDSSIIQFLDTPIINDAFRAIIDWAANIEM